MAKKFKKKGWDKVINNPVAKHSDMAGNAGQHDVKTKYKRKKKHKGEQNEVSVDNPDRIDD